MPSAAGNGHVREGLRKLRVLIIVQNLPVPLDRRVWQECRALIAAGYGVSVICPKGPGDPAYQELEGVRLHKYAAPPTAKGLLGYIIEFAYCWLATAWLMFRVRRRDGFDVMQACNPPDTFFLLGLLGKWLGRPFVFDQHDLCPEVYASRFRQPSRLVLGGLKLLERGTYRVADHVISTNESYRQIALVRGHRSAESVSVVRSGPAATMRPGLPRPALKRGRRFLACYLGVMGPQDGVDLLLHAAHAYVYQLGRRDCQFALMGFGDCLNDLRRQAIDLDLAEWVTFTGRADDRMLGEYLSTADVGLSPDPRSPLNDISTMNKTMEYMAFGLPVVTFDLKETRVSAAEAAVYVPPNDTTAFAQTIANLLDTPQQRAWRGSIGRQRVEGSLAWEHQAPIYVSVYDRLLRREPVLRPRLEADGAEIELVMPLSLLERPEAREALASDRG
jgi:glycosyltransferase involved in cell wall biosynthesis